MGVSQLEDTDSEYVGDSCVENELDDDLVIPESFEAHERDFKQQLRDLQKLARPDSDQDWNPAGVSQTGGSPQIPLKPILSSYHKYLPKQSAPDSSKSERRLLLPSSEPHSSDDEELIKDRTTKWKPMPYGFPAARPSNRFGMKKNGDDLFEGAAASSGAFASVSSFKNGAGVAGGANGAGGAGGGGGGTAAVSQSDLSGVCAIEESDDDFEARDQNRNDDFEGGSRKTSSASFSKLEKPNITSPSHKQTAV